jgi:predicted ATPase
MKKIKTIGPDEAHSRIKRCSVCPEVIRVKRDTTDVDLPIGVDNKSYRKFLSVFMDSSNCSILETYKNQRHCPCTNCFLKGVCSEDCADKIKILRKAQSYCNANTSFYVSSKLDKINKPMAELQKSLQEANKKHEKIQKLYSKKRK